MIQIVRGPVQTIDLVTVYDAEGAPVEVDASGHVLDGTARPARLVLAEKPATERALNGVEIDFSAGFGEAGTDVPDLLRRAILVLAAHWYEFRASYKPADQPVSYPAGYERMIAGYRDRRL